MFQNSPYFARVHRTINSYFHDRDDVDVFLFGSSIRRQRFGDVDIGVDGNIVDRDISELKRTFEESTLPFFVDVVNFTTAPESFSRNVLTQTPVIWIRHSRSNKKN